MVFTIVSPCPKSYLRGERGTFSKKFNLKKDQHCLIPPPCIRNGLIVFYESLMVFVRARACVCALLHALK